MKKGGVAAMRLADQLNISRGLSSLPQRGGGGLSINAANRLNGWSAILIITQIPTECPRHRQHRVRAMGSHIGPMQFLSGMRTSKETYLMMMSRGEFNEADRAFQQAPTASPTFSVSGLLQCP